MRAVWSVFAAVADILPALSWASSPPGPSSVWPQNPHRPPAFVSFPLRCFLDTICNPAAMSCWITALFLVLWSCTLVGLCYHRGLVFTVPTKPNGWACLPWWIAAPWLSQLFRTWDACSGVQQLASTWAGLRWTELSSLSLSRNLLWSSCRSLGCVCIHCKVVWCFQNTVAIPAWKMACARACFPLVPTDSHCSEQNKIWRMCLGSARTH